MSEDREIELRLEPDDVIVRGRLLDLEGSPVSGVHVGVRALSQAKPGDIDRWLQDVADLRSSGLLPLKIGETLYSNDGRGKELQKADFPAGNSLLQSHPQLPADVTTDADGRFEIGGLGADRLVQLEIADPRVVKHQIAVVTRDMPPVEAHRVGIAGVRSHVYYGATFDHIVEPGQTIVGVVEDVETGEPLADTEVRSSAGPGFVSGVYGWHVRKTDKRGRFRIDGMPVGKGNHLEIVPNDWQPYLLTKTVEVPEGQASTPIDIEVKLRRGVFVRGRMLEEGTGEPVAATLHYDSFLSNEHAKHYQRFAPDIRWADYEEDRYQTNERGEFQIVVIPGRGILGVRASDEKFCKGLGAEDIAERNEQDRFPTYSEYSARMYNRLAEIDVAEGTNVVQRDLSLSRGGTATIELFDPSEQPLTGVRVAGRRAWQGLFSPPIETNRVEIKGLRPTRCGKSRSGTRGRSWGFLLMCANRRCPAASRCCRALRRQVDSSMRKVVRWTMPT